MLAKLTRTGQLWHYFGPTWLAYRLVYALRVRSGIVRRQTPARKWSEYPLHSLLVDPALADTSTYLHYRRSAGSAFFFSADDRGLYQPLFATWDLENCPLEHAEQLICGQLRYFAGTVARVGFPPDWHTNPFTGQHIPANRHWSQIDDFGNGDIKAIWEASRFSFAYDLVRAYWRTHDEQYAELFWQIVEDWRINNPPQQGPNWKCGQEVSLRVMAWCFALYGLLDARATTGERVSHLVQMIAVSGERIAANIGYALSQRNNHGISEGMGLWTIGVLFPELQAAQRWRTQGRTILEKLGRRLIYADGAFVQHSLNYQRLMLHAYLWAIRLADLNGYAFSAELRERLGKAAQFLYQLQDTVSGRVPVYGQNDGSLILPLNNCEYHDFRPVIQAVQYLITGTRTYPDGPWDEDLLWLFGSAALQAPVLSQPQEDFRAAFGGYYTLRDNTGFAFLRCATFRDRPGQADMLHLDLWWRGQNIALDAGTYSYNAPLPWNDLGDTAFHNTVTVDNLSQMDRVGKFLWLPWVRSQVRCQQYCADENLTSWEGQHNGYGRLSPPVTHRRGVLSLGDGWWLVVDRLTSQGIHAYRLHWLLPCLPYDWDAQTGRLVLHTPSGFYYIRMKTVSREGCFSVVCADRSSPRGWHAPYYHDRAPAISVDLITQNTTTTFWTLFSPQAGEIVIENDSVQIQKPDGNISIDWRLFC